MENSAILDPEFREAVAAIDRGDLEKLEHLLVAHPRLLGDRADCGEGYFNRPYLLWFVAENPVRNGTLPRNIATITCTILRALEHHGVASCGDQIQYALGLVCSGRVVRECGVQLDLIDLLCEAGADPQGAIVPALAHREVAAVERLLERGAKPTLLLAACTARTDDFDRLLSRASPDERQGALAGAALYGVALHLAQLIERGVDLNAYCPAEFHPHGTALHHAVDSGSLASVQVLVEAGAALDTRDRVYQGTPLDWAEHLGRQAIANYLRARMLREPESGIPG